VVGMPSSQQNSHVVVWSGRVVVVVVGSGVAEPADMFD
jgi:hypothetical protein